MRPLSDTDFVQAYLDGALSPEQSVALELRLRSEPRLADLLIALSREEAILIEWASARAIDVELVDRNFLRIARDQPAPYRPLQRRASRHWAAAALLAASIAAGVAFALLGKFSIAPPSQPAQTGPLPVVAKATETHPEPVALFRLEDVQGDVYVMNDPEKGERVKAQAGQRLTLGQWLQTGSDSSYAVVAVANSRFGVNGNTTVQLQNVLPPTGSGQRTPSMKFFIREGTVGADTVNPNDQPIVVSTPHVEAPLTESRTTITSTPKGTRIEQEKGKKTRVTRKSDGRSLDVQSGWVAVAPANASEQFATQPLPKPTTQARIVLKEDKTSVHSVAYSPDGNVLATGEADGTVKFWNMAASGLAMPGFKVGGKAPVRALAYSPSGNLLAVAAEDKLVKLYEPAAGKEVGVLRGQRTTINCLAFSRDGALLATGGGSGRNGELRIWNVATRVELVSLNGHAGAIQALAFADGRTLATASKDGTVKIWDVIARELKHNLAHAGPVNSVAFAPDGSMLASAGKDLTVKLWETATGAERKSFQGMGGEIRAVAFSPDGATLAAADNSVRLWDVASGQQRSTFLGHKNAIFALAFAPNGKELATVGWDKTIRVWDIPAAAP